MRAHPGATISFDMAGKATHTSRQGLNFLPVSLARHLFPPGTIQEALT